MEAILFLFGAVFLLCVPLAIMLAIGSWNRMSRLKRRVETLEMRLEDLEKGGSGAAGQELPAGAPDAEPPPFPEPPVASTSRPRDLESLVGGQWLTWFGVLTIFFGTAFFLAQDLGGHRLAGPGQVLIGLMVGGLFLLAGMLLARRAQRFLGQGLLGGGVALLFLAAYAAHGFHHLVPATVVYPFLFAVAVVGAMFALAQNSVMVASLTLTGALLTPLLLPAEGDPTRLLFSYLVAVNVGTVILAIRRSWGILPLAGFLGTVILVGAWWNDTYSPELRAPGLLGVGALWFLYGLAPLLARVPRGAWSVARALLILGNGLACELFLYHVLAPDLEQYRGLAASGLAVLYFAGSRVATMVRGSEPGIRMTQYTGIALLALAVPIQFELVGITMAWILLGGVLLWAGVQFDSASHRAWALGVLFLAGCRVVLFDLSRSVDPERFRLLLNVEFLAAALFILVLGWMARLFSRYPPDLRERRMVSPLVISAASVLLWRLTTEVYTVFEVRELAGGGSQELAFLLTLSLIWAFYAGTLILIGFLIRYRPIRILGVSILGMLVLKVFVLDMQELERGYRVASFVGVGLLLLLISVLYQRERRVE